MKLHSKVSTAANWVLGGNLGIFVDSAGKQQQSCTVHIEGGGGGSEVMVLLLQSVYHILLSVFAKI